MTNNPEENPIEQIPRLGILGTPFSKGGKDPANTRRPLFQREGKYSIEYYAFRHLPYAQFQGLNTIFTVFDTLTRIPETVSEPYIARQKLAFFRQDMVNEAAQHPEIRALRELNIDLSPWNDIFTAIETDIDQIKLLDEQDIDRYCRRKRGSLLLMCAEFLKQKPLTDNEKKELIELGIFIERVILLQRKNFPLRAGGKFSAPTTGFFVLLKKLYEALLDLIQKHPDEYVTLNPLHTFLLSLYYRIRGFS